MLSAVWTRAARNGFIKIDEALRCPLIQISANESQGSVVGYISTCRINTQSSEAFQYCFIDISDISVPAHKQVKRLLSGLLVPAPNHRLPACRGKILINLIKHNSSCCFERVYISFAQPQVESNHQHIFFLPRLMPRKWWPADITNVSFNGEKSVPAMQHNQLRTGVL